MKKFVAQDTRTRLIISAAMLFRERGYDGASLSDVLAQAEASKSSLFHHFPAGKEDLALAAAHWANEGMLRILDDAFSEAENFTSGCTNLCHKLAKFMEREPKSASCPVTQILFRAEPDAGGFQAETAHILENWRDRTAEHGVRLGLEQNEAEDRAETLLIALQGAWIVARARQDAGVLRGVPRRFCL